MTSHVHHPHRPLPQRPDALAPAFHARPSRHGLARRAFTLFELLVVLAVTAVIAAITVPRYASAMARYHANFAAKRVAADLELAAATARNASGSRTVKFTGGTYSIDSTTDLNRGSDVYQVRLDREPYNATGVRADFGSRSFVVFDGYGTPDTAGEVSVQVGSVERKVILDSTGKASVE